MPNHYWNEITIYGDKEAIEQIKAKTVKKDDEGNEHIDFNILIPMPEILHRVISPVRDGIMVYELDENGKFDQFKSKYRPANKEELKEIEALPFNNWYDWARHKWGTKWNAYESVVEHDEKFGEICLGFSTAWCSPEHWLEKLEKLCSELDCEFYHKGWDEGEWPRLKNK